MGGRETPWDSFRVHECLSGLLNCLNPYQFLSIVHENNFSILHFLTLISNPHAISTTITELEYKAITSDEMYKIEENAEAILGVRRIYMMENAGHGLADFINSKMGKTIVGKRVVAVCGGGNNGGDAMVCVRHLSDYLDARYTVLLLGDPGNLRTEEARANWAILNRLHSIEMLWTNQIDQVEKKILDADIVIDGILGTGVSGKIREPHSSAVDCINKSEAYTVSVDIPSGLDPNTGLVHDKCVIADATVTFHRMKKGLVNNERYSGQIHLEHIGIPREAELGAIKE
jgi:NAD(P)H-hydrate epimerase